MVVGLSLDREGGKVTSGLVRVWDFDTGKSRDGREDYIAFPTGEFSFNCLLDRVATRCLNTPRTAGTVYCPASINDARGCQGGEGVGNKIGQSFFLIFLSPYKAIRKSW